MSAPHLANGTLGSKNEARNRSVLEFQFDQLSITGYRLPVNFKLNLLLSKALLLSGAAVGF
jgi:hypothetical protein